MPVDRMFMKDTHGRAVEIMLSKAGGIIEFTPSSALPFNADNFATLDTTAVRKYYFGQYGNAFYGVSDGSETAITGTGQASGEVPYWELVDTDANINGNSLSSTWGYNYNGQTILNYTNGLKNTYFSSADQVAMKNAGSDINTSDSSRYGEGSIAASSAHLWPLSVTQVSGNNTLRRALYSGAGVVWTRSYHNSVNNNHYAWSIYDSSGSLGNWNYVTGASSVAPAFNLDLTKVLLPKPALSDNTQAAFEDISVKISEDIKFLINAGTAKSDFSMDATGAYTVSTVSALNSGTNYISAIIYDSEGISVYYGNIQELTQTSGSVDLNGLVKSLNLESGTYTLAVFQEEKCTAYKSDYASEPSYFSFRYRKENT